MSEYDSIQEYLLFEDMGRQPHHVQTRFLQMIHDGVSLKMAAMLACQQAPRTRHTDRTFNAERRVTQARDTYAMNRYVGMAKKAGISTQGKYYIGALGRPTDPMAWVSTVDEAKAVCKKKNFTADGLFQHKGQPMPYRRGPALAPDILQREVAKTVGKEPGLREKAKKDPRILRQVAEKVVADHAPPASD